MNNTAVAIVIIVVLVGGGFLLFKAKNVAPTVTAPVEENTVDESAVGVEVNVDVNLAPRVKEFTVEASSFAFSPKTMVVEEGDTVKITVKNTMGTHDLRIYEFNASTRILQAGEEQTITFVADKNGSFEYYCSVGNHRAMGMVGTLTVR